MDMEDMFKQQRQGEGVGLEYWLQWQVPSCALIFIIPSIIAIKLLKSPNNRESHLLKSTHLWVPCWRNLNPLWLLFYRAFAFASMAFVLYYVIIFLGGAFAFYFYTQWTFLLVTVYFALATIISARGCWIYFKKPLLETKADFLEKLALAIYQTCAGAVMLTDLVFWCLLLPFLLGDKFQLTLLIVSIHSVNAVFLIFDSALNSQPLTWYGIAYFVLWSVSYVVFQWILHACGFTWWPYPFLDLSTPWAPLWHVGLALYHIPCYGVYVLLIKSKDSLFSRMFPYAFIRTRDQTGTGSNSPEKKQK